MAGNTPLKRFKQNVHGGGVRDPLIVHWPRGIAKRGGLRHGFHHVADLPVTVLDVVGVEPGATFQGMEQLSFDGVSMAPTFDDPEARPERGPQIFELFGHRAIVDGNWKAVAWHAGGTSFDEDRWELYDLSRDYSEFEDLAQAEPSRDSLRSNASGGRKPSATASCLSTTGPSTNAGCSRGATTASGAVSNSGRA